MKKHENNGRIRKKNSFRNKNKLKKNEENEMAKIGKACENIEVDKISTFRDLPLSQKTLQGLRDSDFIQPTEIQRESLCLSLRGLDVLGAAKTGSGKTLAFIIPILEVLYIKRWLQTDGLGALVITPTRELAYQIFETLRNVGRYHNFSAGLIIGGKDLHFEKHRMNSCNIMICTPGRLLQHMDENPLFNCDNLQILILDEADRCLDLGFEKTMNSIVENLPVARQTLLFSATQTKSVTDLARLSLKDPMYVSVHEHAKHSTPEGLQQSYVVCELHEKIDTLWSFIKNHRKQKILVFLTSCKQVKYHFEMFCHLRPGISLMALYGTLHQLRRMAIYEEFCRKHNAVLFATDIAARGLDFPEVNWVLHLDCPDDANTYIHRSGRTARYHRNGESLLVLLPSEEEGMIQQLKNKKIPINKIQVNPKKLQSPLMKMQALLAQDPELKATAQRAFASYLKSVYLMKNKTVFNIHALDTDAYARSLGLAIPPKVRFLKKAQKSLGDKHAENGLKAKSPDVQVHAFGTLVKNEKSEVEYRTREERNESSIAEEECPSDNIGFSHYCNDSSDSEEALLKLKRRDHDLEDLPKEVPQEVVKSHTRKLKTKAAVAKKILKKKIVANKKIVFDEDGEAVVNQMREKVSKIAREYETENAGGIDIEKAKLILKEEDKFDKQLFRQKVKAKHREEKMKLKKSKAKRRDEEDQEEFGSGGGEESGSEPDLSWLPDPDSVYSPNEDSKKEIDEPWQTASEEEEEEGRGEEEEERYCSSKENLKRTRDENLNFSSSKRRNTDVTQCNEKQVDLMADEELALHFLKNS